MFIFCKPKLNLFSAQVLNIIVRSKSGHYVLYFNKS